MFYWCLDFLLENKAKTVTGPSVSRHPCCITWFRAKMVALSNLPSVSFGSTLPLACLLFRNSHSLTPRPSLVLCVCSICRALVTSLPALWHCIPSAHGKHVRYPQNHHSPYSSISGIAHWVLDDQDKGNVISSIRFTME